MNEKKNNQSAKISTSSYISIGLVITIIVGLFSFVYQTASIATRLYNHIEDPALHYNIINRVETTYVPRKEFDSRLNGLGSDIKDIKQDIRDIAVFLQKK